MTQYIVHYRTSETHNAVIFNSRKDAVEFAKLYLNNACWPYTAPLTMLIQYAQANDIAHVKIEEIATAQRR